MITVYDVIARVGAEANHARVTGAHLGYSIKEAANENQHGPLCNCMWCEHGLKPDGAA